MRRAWCAVVGEGSTIGVAWVNGHHPEFLSTWICQLKQTDLTENKKARTKIPFQDVRHYLKYAVYESIADTSDTTLKVRQQLL